MESSHTPSTAETEAEAETLMTESEAENSPRPSPSGSGSGSPGRAVELALELIGAEELESKLEAASLIRRLTRTSMRCRHHLSEAIEPLVSLLRLPSPELNQAALLALLNLAVKHEPNKISIVNAGGLNSIIRFLNCHTLDLREHATAAVLTLSASAANKPLIGASGAIHHIVEVLKTGSPQAKGDAVMALYNLSTHPSNLSIILDARPVPSIVNFLKGAKKSSKIAGKCCALVESLVGFEEGRIALASEDGGVLAVVEVLEDGSTRSQEYAVGVLLTLCQSDRSKYREVILNEGAIPGLLELTIHGTCKAKAKATLLLESLRDYPYPRTTEIQPDTLENIVCNIISQINEDDQSNKAKDMLTEMIQVSMEQTLKHLQQRAMVCTSKSNDCPTTTRTPKVSTTRYL